MTKSCMKSMCVFPTEANNAVSYSLLPGPGYELFTINSHTGQISTSTQLDREIQSRFTLRGEIFHLPESSLPLLPKPFFLMFECAESIEHTI